PLAARPGAGGRLRAGASLAGRYILRASTADGRSGQSQVELTAGGAPERVRVQLGPALQR
ncbi:hypothetical protein ACLESO_33245, partial [Pyxidicoccus sp. 3LG]